MRIRFGIAVLFFMHCVFSGYAQFSYKADIKKPSGDNFYRINISPEISSLLRIDYADIRIYNKQNKETGYLLKTEVPSGPRELFHKYNIVKKQQARGRTELIIHNPGKLIDNICLIVKNADIRKRASLTGSNDQKQWFAVKDVYDFSSSFSSTGPEYIRSISFPPSDYQYFRLTIIDSASAPYNIVGAGYYDTYYDSAKYTSVPAKEVILTPDNVGKTSTFLIKFKGDVQMDRIALDISSPKFYYRSARLETRSTDKKGRIISQEIASFQLNSADRNILDIPHMKGREIYLVVENEDNAPLEIKGAKALQMNHYLIAWLEKDNEYTLHFGNEAAEFPHYDLGFFKDKISTELPVAETGTPVKTNKGQDTEVRESYTFFTSKAFLWPAIILIIALLGFVSYRI